MIVEERSTSIKDFDAYNNRVHIYSDKRKPLMNQIGKAADGTHVAVIKLKPGDDDFIAYFFPTGQNFRERLITVKIVGKMLAFENHCPGQPTVGRVPVEPVFAQEYTFKVQAGTKIYIGGPNWVPPHFIDQTPPSSEDEGRFSSTSSGSIEGSV